MRFRRKRRRPQVRKGMHGDWVVGVDDNCFVPASIGLCTDAQFSAPTAVSLIDTNDLIAKEDALTVVRVVGDIPMFASYMTLAESLGIQFFVLTIREGIYLSTVDSTGTAIDLDPRLPADMESDAWLYLRTRAFKFLYVNGGGTGVSAGFWQSGADYAVGQNDHLDLRVKRRMKRGQELVYVFGGILETIQGGITAGDCAVGAQMHLRCYVKY